MKLSIWKCDCCQKEFRAGGGVELRLPLDTFTPDAAGGPSERDHKYRDLCAECSQRLIGDLAKICVTSDAKGQYLKAIGVK